MSKYLEWKKRAMLASLGGWWIPTGLTNENVIAAYRFRGVETEALALTDLTQHAYGLRYRGNNIGWSSATGLTSKARAKNTTASGDWATGYLYDTKEGNGKWLHRENIRAVVFKYANHYPMTWDGENWNRAEGVHPYWSAPGITVYGLSHLAFIKMGVNYHLMNTTNWGTAWWGSVRARRTVPGHTVFIWHFGDKSATIGLNVETTDESKKLYNNGNLRNPVQWLSDGSAGYGWYDFDNNPYDIWGEQNDLASSYDGYTYKEDGSIDYNAKVATDPVPICEFNSRQENGAYSWELCAMAFYNVELTQAQHAEIVQKMSDI